MSVSIQLDTTRLDTIIRQMDGKRNDAIRDAGQDLKDMVQREVVAMGVVDTGNLYHSVEVRFNGSNAVISVGAKSDSGFPYPIAQHEGWTDRGGGWHNGRPFMRVAVEKFRPYYRTNYFGKLFD